MGVSQLHYQPTLIWDACLAISKLHRCPNCTKLVDEMKLVGEDSSKQVPFANKQLVEPDSDFGSATDSVQTSQLDSDSDYDPRTSTCNL